ncbi:hypothetical protein AGMMS49579_09630 [Spirochaetia bacterium]|nr:hypothetical protein AGMMS49579_09630 [Spirochaetia bacterium]
MTNKCSLIQRREIEPLLHRAAGILKSYAGASGCAVSVLDQKGHSLGTQISAEAKSRGSLSDDGTKTRFFSELCKQYYYGPAGTDSDEHPCTGMRMSSELGWAIS